MCVSSVDIFKNKSGRGRKRSPPQGGISGTIKSLIENEDVAYLLLMKMRLWDVCRNIIELLCNQRTPERCYFSPRES